MTLGRKDKFPMSRKEYQSFSGKRSSVERTKVLVELCILTFNVASDTHEVVKHMLTIENTFYWYGE